LLEPWQEDITRTLFGTVNALGCRQYRTAYIEVPRKNGTSTWVAGIALRLLFEGEPGAEIYGAASDRDQASIVFNIAASMVRKSPALERRCRIIDTQKRIVVPKTESVYRALPADAAGAHGYNSHGIVFDELHTQPNRELWDVLTSSVGARDQPLTIAITTAGFDRESICWEQHQYALAVRDGEIDDPTFLPVIYAAPPEAPWDDPDVWRQANPCYGVSIRPEYLAEKCAQAQRTPAAENTFRRLHLNQWTEQAVRWLPMERWDACAGPVSEAELLGRDCYGGLDLATVRDLAALVLVFPDDGGYVVLPYFWCPTDGARQRQRQDRAPYLDWFQAGFLELTDGATTDYAVIRRRINELSERFHVREIAIDRWNSTQLQQQLDGDGLTVVQFGQGFAAMSAPTKEVERLVVEGKLRHGGHPVLRWNAANVSVEEDAAGNKKPSKKKSSEKIDGIVALVMAIGRAMVQPEQRGSVYESRGALIL
jgi:phage terminase large subunit-like protein